MLDLLDLWLAQAGLSKTAAINRLGDDDFPPGQAPQRHMAMNMLAGRAPLTREFLEAIERICFKDYDPKRVAAAVGLLEQARATDRIRLRPAGTEALESELLGTLRELRKVQEAHARSEEQRRLAVQVAFFAVQALQRTEATVAKLRTQVEQSRVAVDGSGNPELQKQLGRAMTQVEELRAAKELAEKERTDAVRVAQEAQRRIAELEDQLTQHGTDLVPTGQEPADAEPGQPLSDASAMDAVDQFLGEAFTRLDLGRELVDEAAYEAGLPSGQVPPDARVIAGAVLPSHQTPERYSGQGLSGVDAPKRDPEPEPSKTATENNASPATWELAQLLRSIRERAGVERWPLDQLSRVAFQEPPYNPQEEACRQVIVRRWMAGEYPPRRFDALARLLSALGATKEEQAKIETLLRRSLPPAGPSFIAIGELGYGRQLRMGVVAVIGREPGSGTIVDTAGATYLITHTRDLPLSPGGWVFFNVQTPPGGSTTAVNVMRTSAVPELDAQTTVLMRTILDNLSTRHNSPPPRNLRREIKIAIPLVALLLAMLITAVITWTS
ncbi:MULTISPECIES: hypothetical protein [Streptacidiphilus]|uniref:Uncharacterized protein n=1 Tax=Streptacidiphilus cavernicola TaxID=3342716 RepID=A0ABV6V197_9ACTN|nr:hypothetical protein [Streptacidiphilus jeojiense]